MAGSAHLNADVLVDSLVTDVIDGLRSDLHPQFGVRAYRAYTVKRTWNGLAVGEGDYTDTELELEPQPLIQDWDGLRYELSKLGITEKGGVKATEISLTYTYEELAGGSLEANQEWFIKIAEAHGQGNPDRYFAHARPPYVDRVKDMGWVMWLRPVNMPGCRP